MSFILNQKYSDGNTPIRPEEAQQLIPRISTLGELNEYEAVNILRAREWAFDSRAMKSMGPLEPNSGIPISLVRSSKDGARLPSRRAVYVL